MRLVSTEGRSPPVDFHSALFQGTAPDGGLYMPERFEPAGSEFFESLRGACLPAVAGAVAGHVLGEDVGRVAEAAASDAFDFDVPLVELSDGVRVLELFHGPTLAFKDVGARFMAKVLVELHDAGSGPLTVLVATSGDTGSAVASAFLGVEGVRTVVLFPEGRVSPFQERQFTTLGGNVRAVAVDGTFDDCQRLAKRAFASKRLRASLRLTSANSINIARLVPQMFYYVHAWACLPAEAPPPLFSVPSGNFGNLTAGLMARAMGLPVAGFVAATNVNDVVPEYLESGVFRPRPAMPTLSSAMDVGNPSNFERVSALYDGDLGRLREDVVGSVHDDDATRRCMADVYARTGYALDPHTAVGYLGVEAGLHRWPDSALIVLATAHPAKFGDAVSRALGVGVPVPSRLAERIRAQPAIVRLPAEEAALEELLLRP